MEEWWVGWLVSEVVGRSVGRWFGGSLELSVVDWGELV